MENKIKIKNSIAFKEKEDIIHVYLTNHPQIFSMTFFCEYCLTFQVYLSHANLGWQIYFYDIPIFLSGLIDLQVLKKAHKYPCL